MKFLYKRFLVLPLPPAGPSGQLPPLPPSLLYRHITPYYVFGLFCLLAPLPLSIGIYWSEEFALMSGLLVFSSLALAVALFMFFRANRLYRQRQLALSEGRIYTATVVGKGRRWVFWRSKPFYSLRLRFELEGQKQEREVVQAHEALHLFPLEAKLLVLYHAPSDGFSSGLDLDIVFAPTKPAD